MSEAVLLAVGDLILDEPGPDGFFALAAPRLRTGSVVLGHVEVPHTRAGVQSTVDVPAPASDPRNLEALGRAGFNVVTLAGNHVFDQGVDGVRDTLAALRAQGIVTAGAGMDLTEARRPAVLEREGIRFAVLSYNAVGPKESWATGAKAGGAYVRVLSHYEMDIASPGGPPEAWTFATPETLAAVTTDIAAARDVADIVIVAVHKGRAGTMVPEFYERQIAHAAIDAGASIVLGHHAHVLYGIEIYRGRPIFHGLGNFVTVTRALSSDPNENANPDRLAYVRRRRSTRLDASDPLSRIYPFSPESRSTMIAKCVVRKDGDVRASFLPCFINDHAQPEILGRGERGERVLAFVRDISEQAGFRTRFTWDGDEVMVQE